MATAMLLTFGYALAVGAPALLNRLGRRISPRTMLLAIHVVAVSVLLAFFLAAVTIVFAAYPPFSAAAAGLLACFQFIVQLPQPVITVALAALLGAVAVRIAIHVRSELAADTTIAARHSDAARIVGRPVADDPMSYPTVLLDTDTPAAYCLPGDPGLIVMTRGAHHRLTEEQRHAVLAHEAAHLRGRHHQLRAIWRGLASALPGLPIFSWAPNEVSHLCETRADDTAARHYGAPTVASALLEMATLQLPVVALGATGGRLAERIARLYATREQSPTGKTMALLLTAGIIGLPVAFITLASPLAAPLLNCTQWMVS